MTADAGKQNWPPSQYSSHAKQKNNLLDLDQNENSEWFAEFEQLDNSLTKSLFLVALMQAQGLISVKESLIMKRYLMQAVDDQ